MHLILTGATGLVGGGVLDAMIKMKDVTKISILSRRPVKMAEDAKDPRINVIIHQDFNKYPKELLDQLQDATGCVWALGVSQTKVGLEDYINITKNYTISAAEAFQSSLTSKATNKPFNFVFVSGAGATFQPRFYTPLYAKIKGETELGLAEVRKANPLFRAHTTRPNAVDPSQHPALMPYVPEDATVKDWKLGLAVAAISRFAKVWHSPTEPMGKFFTEMAMGKHDAAMEQDVKDKKPGIERLDGGFMVLENNAIRRLGGFS